MKGRDAKRELTDRKGEQVDEPDRGPVGPLPVIFPFDETKGDSMAECENTGKHPTETLANEINKFVQDIDCLYTTLPLLMTVMTIVKKEAHQKYQTFIDEKASDKFESDNHITYTIKVDDIAKNNRLKRRFTNADTATTFIPRHFITSLVSQYDSFLGSVLRFIFEIKPEVLNASEKAIQFAELLKFPDIEAARQYIIEKEVETIIRKNHVDQFSWLKEKLGIPFNKNLKSWPVFVELNERRNLFVHCDGRVSSQYLRCCTDQKCDIDPKLFVGVQLKVDPGYFREAYKCVYEIGVKMAHVVWRKLCPSHAEGSDDNIIALTYGLVEGGQYDLAIRLLDFFTEPVFKHSCESNRYIMIVNRAQAYKWSGDDETNRRVLDEVDWSATEDQFKLAVAVLRDEFDHAYDIMRRLKYDTSFHRASYKDWPLFKEARKQEKFPQVYEECYGEPFKIQRTEDYEIPIDEPVAAPDQPHDAASR